jgi:hypothetical protein
LVTQAAAVVHLAALPVVITADLRFCSDRFPSARLTASVEGPGFGAGVTRITSWPPPISRWHGSVAAEDGHAAWWFAAVCGRAS